VFSAAEHRYNDLMKKMELSYGVEPVQHTKGIQERLRIIAAEMEAGLIERGTEIRLLLLAAISGEHVLFIGPPGTAKSELGRRLSRVCKGPYFERLLTRFSVPEELFGPLSMRALEEDQYIRQIEGYLPESQVAFIDEIFKANSAILNTLLTILNERLFDNGNHRYRIPLICLVGASNELPESEALDALYDRFLFRQKVKQLSAKGLSELISSMSQHYEKEAKNSYTYVSDSPPMVENLPEHSNNHGISIDDDELLCMRSEAHRLVRVPSEIIQLVTDVRDYMQTKVEPPVYISDRRLFKAVNMLKVAAYTNGRIEISPFDCLLLQHCLWQKPEEQELVFEFLLDKLSADEEVPNFEVIMQRIFARCCLMLTGASKDDMLQKDLESLQKDVISRLAQMTTVFAGALPVLSDNIWIGREEAFSLSSAVVPKTAKTKTQLQDLLLESEVLKVILDTGKEPSVCAELLGQRWADFLKTPLKLKENNP
jgi:MoxR-like ATPase